MTALARLRKLEAEATPGPWVSSELWEDQGSKNVAFIVAARNALPALIEIAEAASAILAEFPDAPGEDDGPISELEVRLRAALARLEAGR